MRTPHKKTSALFHTANVFEENLSNTFQKNFLAYCKLTSTRNIIVLLIPTTHTL